MRATVCWTLGNTSNFVALEVLKESVNCLRKLYNLDFKYVLKYNNLSKDMLSRLPDVFDEVIDQQLHTSYLLMSPPKARFLGGCAWKLYPCVVDDNYQIMMDNDIIIWDRIFDPFIESDEFMVTEAIKRSYTPRLHEFIRPDFNINTGLIGLPRNSNVVLEINRITKNHDVEWTEYFDEQSVMAIFLQEQDVHVFPKDAISVVGKETPYYLGKSGIHFVGLNSGYNDHWYRYKRRGLF